MAKPTRGESESAETPEAVEEIVNDTVEAVADDKDTDPIVDEAETVEEDSSEETDVVELVEEIAPAAAAPEVVRETVVERKGGFLPMLLGGVVAAGIGIVSSEYIFPDGVPFGPNATKKIDFETALNQQAGRIDDLTTQLENQSAPDLSALDDAVATVGDLQSQLGAVVDSIASVETRIDTLEAQPRGGEGISVAMEKELKDLRGALDLQKGELAQMLDEAQLTKQNAEETARRALARGGVTRILVALESGAPFADALAEVEANSDIALPEALTATAAEGAPTLAALAEGFPDAARAALAAVRSEETGGGVTSFLAKQLGARSVAPREGDDPDAVLSRAEAAVGEGRIEDALALVDALPEAAKAPLADWVALASSRLNAAREAEALANSLNSQ
ncbi:hypothetical protein [Planktotalea sp.]|uniref:COG4223 family protein n=1 Tax=Planktotalea sp. TaxID=2029877 RepID=UPI003299A816